VPIVIKQNISNPRKLSTRRNFSDENISELNKTLQQQQWNNIYIENNKKWNTFITPVIHHFNTVLPIINTKVRKKKRSPISSPQLDTIKQEMDILYILQNYFPEAKKLFQNKKVQYRQLLHASVKHRNDMKINNSDNKSKAMWSIVNNVLNRDNSVIDSNCDLTPNAENLNNYFVNCVSELLLGKTDRYVNTIRPQSRSAYFYPATTQEVKQIVLGLKNKKSCGEDGISPYLLKRIIFSIAEPITHILNASLQSGVFPNQLKIAVVKPLYKKGALDKPSNYRPISQLTAMSKIFEQVLCSRIKNT
jgi:hypothetical protein